MTDKEAMKLALDALEANYLLVNGTETHGGLEQCLDGYYSSCFDTDPINKQTEEAIAALKERLAQEVALQALHDENELLGLYEDAYAQPEPVGYVYSESGVKSAAIQRDLPNGTPLFTTPPSVKLRRGDILQCIETDELCTVWSTSTTGKTLVKWSANNFGNYTAEQIGELFWLKPKQEQEPVAWMWDVNNGGGYTSKGIGFMQTNIPFAKHTPLYAHPPQRTEEKK